MIIFRNSNAYVFDNLDERDNTVSTLLIPENMLEDFLGEKGKHQDNISIYLRKLLRRYRSLTHSGMIPTPIKVKTEYQEEGLNLKKINFRPMNSDWVELGELGLAFGKSRCWMFIYLLKLDLLGLWRILVKVGFKKIVPTLPNLELKSIWTLQRVQQNFARGYHIKV